MQKYNFTLNERGKNEPNGYKNASEAHFDLFFTHESKKSTNYLSSGHPSAVQLMGRWMSMAAPPRVAL